MPEMNETVEDEMLPVLHEIAEVYEIAETETLPEKHETAPETYETAEDESSPEVHDIADKGVRRSGKPHADSVPTERDGETRKAVLNPTSERDGNPSSDTVHCRGTQQWLESLANTTNGGYQCERNSGCKL